MTAKKLTVAVTGSAGHIGYATIFRLASGQMFGPNTQIELQLIELESALPSLEGVVMELDDCAFPLLKKISYTSDLKKGFEGANWVILVGAVPRKKGMERSDLLEVNGAVFKEQGQAINNVAADNVRVFVVGNPCNTNCLIAMNNAGDVPQDRFYAMTMLDELRAKAQLAKKAQVDITQISHMAIWGNHSATQFPDFYHAQINGRHCLDVIQDESWLQKEFIQTIQQRGAAVIKARGASSAASAANAIVNSIYQLSHDTASSDPYSVCLCSQGEYDVDAGLIFSYPCFTQDETVHVKKGIMHNDFAKAKLQLTLDELRQECEMVKKLNLI